MSESIEMSSNLLSEPYALSAAQISEYRESGAVRLPGMLDAATLDGVRETIRRLTLEGARATVPLEERDTYGRAFTQVFNLWRRDAAARAFALSSRLARVATELMGAGPTPGTMIGCLLGDTTGLAACGAYPGWSKVDSPLSLTK